MVTINKSNLIKIIFIFIIVCITVIITYSFNRERIIEIEYDYSQINPDIKLEKDIDKLFSSFTTIKFNDIPEIYLDKSHYSKKKYAKRLANKTFYELTRDDLQKKAVYNYRIKDFIHKDASYRYILRKNDKFYTCLDPKVLKKFVQLLNLLKSKNLNTDAIKLRSGHRSPKSNYWTGGASQSRHIYGDAIDIRVGDVNNDGKSNKKDKDLIIHLLNTQIIRSEGGIGLYPGTKAVHFDTRGYRARWNTYTPAIRKKKKS